MHARSNVIREPVEGLRIENLGLKGGDLRQHLGEAVVILQEPVIREAAVNEEGASIIEADLTIATQDVEEDGSFSQ